jgi:hypothetical protein
MFVSRDLIAQSVASLRGYRRYLSPRLELPHPRSGTASAINKSGITKLRVKLLTSNNINTSPQSPNSSAATMPPKQAPVKGSSASKPRPASSPVKNAYLLAYNAVSAALWAGVLYKTVTIGAHEVQTARKAGSFFGRSDFNSVVTGLGSGKVFSELEQYTRLVQSLAGLEVLHSLVGMFSIPLRSLAVL